MPDYMNDSSYMACFGGFGGFGGGLGGYGFDFGMNPMLGGYYGVISREMAASEGFKADISQRHRNAAVTARDGKIGKFAEEFYSALTDGSEKKAYDIYMSFLNTMKTDEYYIAHCFKNGEWNENALITLACEDMEDALTYQKALRTGGADKRRVNLQDEIAKYADGTFVKYLKKSQDSDLILGYTDTVTQEDLLDLVSIKEASHKTPFTNVKAGAGEAVKWAAGGAAAGGIITGLIALGSGPVGWGLTICGAIAGLLWGAYDGYSNEKAKTEAQRAAEGTSDNNPAVRYVIGDDGRLREMPSGSSAELAALPEPRAVQTNLDYRVPSLEDIKKVMQQEGWDAAKAKYGENAVKIAAEKFHLTDPRYELRFPVTPLNPEITR